MTFSVPMLPNSGATLAAGAAGDYDSYFQSIAQGLVSNNEASSIVRIGWEFNGGWYTWSANSSDAATFVTFWQRIVDAMRSVSGENFKFEWCPTLGDQGVGNLANYYPGNGYVDDVAADVYDEAWGSYPGAAQEFSNLETEAFGLDWLSSFAAGQGKPIALGEWGLGSVPGHAGQAYSADNQKVSGGDDPTFIDDMANWIATNDVIEATYFDFGSSALSPSSNPNSYHALIADFGPGGVASGPAGASSSTTTTTAPPSPAPSPAPSTTTTTTSPPAPAPAPTTTTVPAPAPSPAPATGTVPTSVPTPGLPPSPETPTPTSSSPQPVTPAGAPPSAAALSATTTTLKTNELLAFQGGESSMVFTVSVSPAENATVTVVSGNQKLCEVTVTTSDGSGSCALTDSELGLGLYPAQAETPAGSGFTGSTSNTATFTVVGLDLLSTL
jgi:outer membrane biosynthesis protein TonB